MMKTWMLLLIAASLALGGCAPAPSAAAPTIETPKPSATNTTAPSPTTTSTPVPTLTPTITPSPTPDELEILRQEMVKLIDSEDWPIQGMSDARMAAWEGFISEGKPLDAEEIIYVQTFLERYQTFRDIIDKEKYSSDTTPGFRVKEFDQGEGITKPVLYVVDEVQTVQKGTERFYLIVHDNYNRTVGLKLTNELKGFSQQISEDGDFIEYFEPEKVWLFKADARLLKIREGKRLYLNKFDYAIKERLDEYSPKNNCMDREGFICPRYYFNIPEIGSEFYAIESLTYHQIILLEESLHVYDNSELNEAKQFVFPINPQFAYVISTKDNIRWGGLGYTFDYIPGHGTMVLFTKNLHGNRYTFASVLGHEAAHIWQKRSQNTDYCWNEVGNTGVPNGFDQWSAEEVFQAVTDLKIGSIHVELWIAYQMGSKELIQKYTNEIHSRSHPSCQGQYP